MVSGLRLRTKPQTSEINRQGAELYDEQQDSINSSSNARDKGFITTNNNARGHCVS